MKKTNPNPRIKRPSDTAILNWMQKHVSYIRRGFETWRIGAMTTHREMRGIRQTMLALMKAEREFSRLDAKPPKAGRK